MTPSPIDPTQVEIALSEYLAARESGNPPARSKFLASHAAIAAELAEALDALDAIRGDFDSPFPTLGEYEIVRVAGRGGMGVVYEAIQLDPPRRVALKVLAPKLVSDQAARRRFLTEVHVASRLHHTNIVPVFATVPGSDGLLGYVMPFISGESLAAVLRRYRMSVGDQNQNLNVRSAVEWVRQAAEAAAAAHVAGVTHRDIKPANLLLEVDRGGRPHVWLHDFGLAAVDNDPITDPTPAGTPGYASPEQAAGDPQGSLPTTDVYALGVTLAELLTLTKPVQGAPPPSSPSLPRELRRVISKATSVDPVDRYPTAAELADDLGRFLVGQPVQAGQPAVLRVVGLWATRHRRALVAAALGFMVATASGSALLWRAYKAESDAHRATTEARVAGAEARRAVAGYTLTLDDILYAIPGQLDTERRLLEQAVAVQEAQLQAEPNDRHATRYLAHACWRLGRVYSRLGDPAKAVAACQRAAELYLVLAAAEPTEPLHTLDAARAYSVLGAVYRTTGAQEESAALEADAEAMRLTQKLVGEFPDDVRVRDAAATYLAMYGTALKKAGRHGDAEAAYRGAATEADKCQQRNPELWRLASAAAHARGRLAESLASRGRIVEALAENATAVKLTDGLVARSIRAPTEVDRLERLSFRLSQTEWLADRGEWLLATGADAGETVSRLSAAVKVLLADNPDRVGSQPLAVAQLSAWVAYRSGDLGDAFQAYEKAVLALPPGANRSVLLSRLYAFGPGPEDAERAKIHAIEALEAAPNLPAARLALAAALYRLGQYAESAAELTRLENSPPNRSVVLLRAAVAGRTGRAMEGLKLFREAASKELPVELCNPELEQEARRALGLRD